MPQEKNRVDLDPRVRDAWGMPAARITHSWTKVDYEVADFVMDKGEYFLKEAGDPVIGRDPLIAGRQRRDRAEPVAKPQAECVPAPGGAGLAARIESM